MKYIFISYMCACVEEELEESGKMEREMRQRKRSEWEEGREVEGVAEKS